jgi:ligand-binding sensor protein
LPIGCLQPVQDVFADMAEVGAITTAPDGTPLTKLSNCCRFCALILATESGRRACIASWSAIARQPGLQPHFVTCHAGLQYARARIEVNHELVALLIAGQFYASPPTAEEQNVRVRKLAQQHGLDAAALADAATHLSVLDERTQGRIGDWLERVSHTFEHVGHERVALLNRLRRIAAMSSVESL